MSNVSQQLSALTQAIEKLIATPVAPIAPIAPVAPVLPIIQTNTGDHDLLTKLDSKVDQIQLDVTMLKNQGNLYVTQEQHKEVVRQSADHETRLRLTEKSITQIATWGTAGIVVVGILETLFLKFVR